MGVNTWRTHPLVEMVGVGASGSSRSLTVERECVVVRPWWTTCVRMKVDFGFEMCRMSEASEVSDTLGRLIVGGYHAPGSRGS